MQREVLFRATNLLIICFAIHYYNSYYWKVLQPTSEKSYYYDNVTSSEPTDKIDLELNEAGNDESSEQSSREIDANPYKNVNEDTMRSGKLLEKLRWNHVQIWKLVTELERRLKFAEAEVMRMEKMCADSYSRDHRTLPQDEQIGTKTERRQYIGDEVRTKDRYERAEIVFMKNGREVARRFV